MARKRRSTEPGSERTRRHRPDERAPAGFRPRAQGPDEVLALVERLPDEPGVYVMRDREGHVLYIGKARRLRARVRQYFNGADTRDFVPRLGDLVGDIETVVTRNDKEAMLLENTLIKQHHPRFNVKLRDDKQYLVLRLDAARPWPRVEVVRNAADDGVGYFGPYHSATSARHTLRVVNRHFQLRTCSDFVLAHRTRPCLQYQIGRCPAPCVFEVDRTAYAEQVRDVGLFLAGRHAELVHSLRARMETAAADLRFEAAARIRDQLAAIETTLQSQQVVGRGRRDQDVVGLHREGGQVDLVLLEVRHGKLMGTQSFSHRGLELPTPRILYDFVRAFYEAAPLVPDEILLPERLADEDAESLQEWLRERSGRRTVLLAPERGDRRRMVDLARRNATSSFTSRRDHEGDVQATLERLRERLDLARAPRRIECFDVSHIQGHEPVASMVVFTDGVPDRAAYRRFKIRGVSGQLDQNDDFASMYEVLSRRLRRGLEDEAWPLPDLLLIDGGKGQLARVVAAMQDLGVGVGVDGIDVAAIAKPRRDRSRETLATLRRRRTDEGGSTVPGRALEDWVLEQLDPPELPASAAEGDDTDVDRVFVPGRRDPIRLRTGSSELFLITRLRDEAHRFAIEHHRRRRRARSLASELDAIPGVGPALRKRLLARFGSVAGLRGASADELQTVPGVGAALARRIADALAGAPPGASTS
jgi:excinuclease ABC subunit C